MTEDTLIQAVILAGGLGTRLRPFTETTPKPMLPVLGRPFLEYQIELLKNNGITRLVLLIGYLGEIIEKHLGKREGIVYSYEANPLGTGGALKNASALLEDDFLVLNGDTLLDIEYGEIVEQFRYSKRAAMIVAHHNLRLELPSNLTVDSADTVLEYCKQRSTGEYIDAGVLALRKAVLDFIPESRECSLELEVFPQLIAARQMVAWRTEKPFYDMGTPSGLAALEKHFITKQGN